jgi:hypothetical protein
MRRGQKSQFQHGRNNIWLKNKLQQSGNERGQKVYFSMARLGQKKEKKVEKIVKKLSKSSKNCQTFCQTW